MESGGSDVDSGSSGKMVVIQRVVVGTVRTLVVVVVVVTLAIRIVNVRTISFLGKQAYYLLIFYFNFLSKSLRLYKGSRVSRISKTIIMEANI